MEQGKLKARGRVKREAQAPPSHLGVLKRKMVQPPIECRENFNAMLYTEGEPGEKHCCLGSSDSVSSSPTCNSVFHSTICELCCVILHR